MWTPSLRRATAAALSPAALFAAGCAAPDAALESRERPIPGDFQAVPELIEPGEEHFAELWKLTSGGENAEAYWSFDGSRLVLQRRNPEEGVDCDRIYVTLPDGSLEQVSDGRGVTTCSFFLPGDDAVLFGSTGAVHEACPPPPDRSLGYVWELHPEYDIYRHDLRTGETTPLVTGPGYDTEATVSPTGDRIVFTSTRSGDPELFTCALDGSDVRQVTSKPGYDGGAFFSHDGRRLVFRSTAFTPGAEAEEQAEFARLLEQDLVRPSDMEIMVCDADGGNRTQVTALGRANWAPYFFPTDDRIIFSTNHHVEGRSRNFDLFAVDDDGGDLERITTYEGFDAFPMFSRDGRWLVFSSNRGGAVEGETNVFLARWKD
jgi:Tol biopolymer transport system component